ncbi:hypothetical protein P4H83_07970 [Paenibacillus favisporus]|nr:MULTISPECIES: hypothetical protein [Paenibacillus]MEC0174808.1 hypothetical protein [Paenibacillus favisporus]
MKLESCNGKKLYAQGRMQWDAWTLGVRLFWLFGEKKVGMISLPQAVFSI